MERYFFLFLFIIICASVLLLYCFPSTSRISAKTLNPAAGNNSTYRLANVTINGFNLLADVPITIDQFHKGLDIKNNIKESQGMLFIFKEPGKKSLSFWMHGMKFPIDIIWFDNNSNVVKIERNLPPCITGLVCPSYIPDKDSLYVLETAANFTQRHNVKIGTHMNFHLIK